VRSGVTHTSNNFKLLLLVGHPLLLACFLLLQEVLQQRVYTLGLLAERGESGLTNRWSDLALFFFENLGFLVLDLVQERPFS
jgi:hypothetical protein